jgi:predicted phage baseplate assembly protein
MATIDYSNRDYDSIRADLLSRATEMVPEWTARNSSDFGVLFVDLWSYFADVLHYYIDRAAGEAFITTATQRESLLALASLFDYSPQLQTSSTATVTVVGTNIPAGQTVTINSGTTFVAPATSERPIIYFTSTQSASASASSNAVIPVVEGLQVSNETVGTSNGSSNQRFSLFYSGVIGNSVQVFVQEGTVVNGVPSNVEYQFVDKLLDSTSNDRVFTLVSTASNGTDIVFGNGINGKIPNTGQTVVVNYRKGVGVRGNIPANSITQIQNSPSTYLSEILSTASTGGSNVESLDSLKNNIPSSFATQDRAVSLSDYKALTLQVAGIAKGTAAYENGTVTVHAAPFTEGYLTIAGNTLSVSSDLQNNIVAYYEPRQMVGASVTAASVINLTAVNVTATVNVLAGYVASKVSESVETALDTLFEFENVFFNQTLSKGQIYRTILDVPGVDYVTLSLPSTETVTSGEYGLLKKGTYTITTVGGVS